MKSKVIYCLNFLWSSIIAFTFPICLGCLYLDITGNAKGYGYDLGAEKDITIMLGIVKLLVWLALAIPSNIYVFKKTKERGTSYLIIPIIVFIMLFILCIHLIGGWNEFERFFHA